MGSPLSGSGSIDLISNEGIATVGLLVAFFPAVLGVSLGHLLVGLTALKRGGFQIFCCLRFWRGLGACPSSQRRSGFWPSSSGPVASRPPLGIGLLRRPRGDFFSPGRFHVLVFHAWRLASGSSGSRTSRYGLLVYVQGASDPLPHSSPGGEVVASGIAVRALLQATSLPLGMDDSPAPGQSLSVSTF